MEDDRKQFSLVFSVAALVLSAWTFWFVHVRSGRLSASRPQSVFFGPDGGTKDKPKVFVSTFLYSSADKGCVIESLFMQLKIRQTTKNFTVWVYDQGAGLRRGSGLFVGRTGFAANHHFILPSDSDSFGWQAGEYQILLVAKVASQSSESVLWSEKLVVSSEHASRLSEGNVGVYFDWDPDRQEYDAHVNSKRHSSPNDPITMVQLIDNLSSAKPKQIPRTRKGDAQIK